MRRMRGWTRGEDRCRAATRHQSETTANSFVPLIFFLQAETKSGMYDTLKVHVHRAQRQFPRARLHSEILQEAMSLRTRRMNIEHIKEALEKHGLLRPVTPRGIARRDALQRYRPCKFATHACRNRVRDAPHPMQAHASTIVRRVHVKLYSLFRAVPLRSRRCRSFSFSSSPRTRAWRPHGPDRSSRPTAPAG